MEFTASFGTEDAFIIFNIKACNKSLGLKTLKTKKDAKLTDPGHFKLATIVNTTTTNNNNSNI